jgi:pyrimidine operon attenuation protein / uracil phosphoribosyltransferase
MPPKNSVVLDARAVDRTLKRMADEILELNNGTDDLIIVGIQRRGVQLASRIVDAMKEREGVDVPRGALDITLYRDDLQTVGPRPVVGPTDLPWNLEGKHVVIIDDVLYTGRTVRAALDELADFGRPARIALAVLVDRGGRELPIHADIVGKKIEVAPRDRVDVLVEELDGKDAVVVVPRDEGAVPGRPHVEGGTEAEDQSNASVHGIREDGRGHRGATAGVVRRDGHLHE